MRGLDQIVKENHEALTRAENARSDLERIAAVQARSIDTLLSAARREADRPGSVDWVALVAQFEEGES